MDYPQVRDIGIWVRCDFDKDVLEKSDMNYN